MYEGIDSKEIVEELRILVEEGRKEIFTMHRSGAGGLEVVRRRADLLDNVIERIYAFCEEAARRAGFKINGGTALVALGGYGRREMNPCSDVDILFLHRRMNPFIDFLVKETLYILWDLDLQVGHSCRTVSECLNMAAGDSTVKTAMVECRRICGDEKITGELVRAIRKRFLSGKAKGFIKAKMSEQVLRHAQYGESVNCLEPHIKEGVGGLRDAHLALWCGITRFGLKGLRDLESVGLLSSEELGEFMEAYDFMHRVRNELHFIIKHRSDVLFMEVQKEVADNLGYQSDGVFPAVELFMREYFLKSRDIARYSRLALDRCSHKGWFFTRLGSAIRRRKIDEGICSLDGEIVVEGNPFAEHPLLLLKLFGYGRALGLAPCQSAMGIIRENLHLIDENFAASPEARDIFLEILSGDGAAEALHSMHEAGVLGKYIPEFGELTCLAQHDLYHRYTVDEHELKAVKHLEGLKDTAEAELKELSSMYKRVHKPWLLKLAVLLHDIGKIKGRGHVKSGVAISSGILERLKLEDADRKKILFLVEHHLVMSHLSQRRNINDDKMISSFARTVGNEENLALLYLLTYADTMGVGLHVWTIWKGALLWELYHETYNYFVRGGKAEYTWEVTLEKVRSKVMSMLSEDIDPEEVENYFHTMPYRYLVVTPSERLARHLELVHRMEDKTVSLDCSHDFLQGYTELLVCSREKPGLFSRIAGALSAMNINIISAQIYTGTDGSVLDILQVNGLDGKPVTDQDIWDKVNNYLERILEGKLTVEQLMVGRKKPLHAKKAEHMKVPPRVELDNTSSDTHTIIEVIAQDRLGLLYSITNTLFKEGANIYLAKIST